MMSFEDDDEEDDARIGVGYTRRQAPQGYPGMGVLSSALK
jgi:hypothetical protein